MDDFDMVVAYDLANTLGPPPRLATELKDPTIRAQFLEFVDNNIVAGTSIFDILEDKKIIRDSFLTDLANKTSPWLKSIPEPYARINLTLRLWVGCTETTKVLRDTIVDVKDGLKYERQISPRDREKYFMEVIEAKSQVDPIYLAGLEAAPILRKEIRQQEIFWEGIEKNSKLFKCIEKYLSP